MNIKIIKIILSWVAVIASVFMICNFSMEDSTESTETSSGLIKDVLEVVMPEEEITPEVIKKYQLPVRKIAHFGIYMLLGFCLGNAFVNTTPLKLYFNLGISLISLFAFSVFDEMIIQSATKGRGPAFTDCLIDTAGGFLGILTFCLILFIKIRILSKKNPS